jgi:hypothetical protein
VEVIFILGGHMTRREQHDALWEQADAIIKRANPCDFVDGLCIRERIVKSTSGKTSSFCCCRPISGKEWDIGHCVHFVEGSGCGIKSIACKTWLCGEAERNISIDDRAALGRIEKQAIALDFYVTRGNPWTEE